MQTSKRSTICAKNAKNWSKHFEIQPMGQQAASQRSRSQYTEIGAAAHALKAKLNHQTHDSIFNESQR